MYMYNILYVIYIYYTCIYIYTVSIYIYQLDIIRQRERERDTMMVHKNNTVLYMYNIICIHWSEVSECLVHLDSRSICADVFIAVLFASSLLSGMFANMRMIRLYAHDCRCIQMYNERYLHVSRWPRHKRKTKAGPARITTMILYNGQLIVSTYDRMTRTY